MACGLRGHSWHSLPGWALVLRSDLLYGTLLANLLGWRTMPLHRQWPRLSLRSRQGLLCLPTLACSLKPSCIHSVAVACVGMRLLIAARHFTNAYDGVVPNAIMYTLPRCGMRWHAVGSLNQGIFLMSTTACLHAASKDTAFLNGCGVQRHVNAYSELAEF